MTDKYLKDEYHDEIVTGRQNKDNGWWMWALLLPIFFMGGWLFNDWWQSPATTAPETQYGVGGAPGDSVIRSSPRVESPIVIESPDAEMNIQTDEVRPSSSE